MPTFLAVAERGVTWTGGQLSRATEHVWTFLSPKDQKSQTPHGGKRWQMTALPPKASPPPSPLLPSEMKYSASLVRGQAVVHGALGVILFTFGVLGSHRWAATTCVPGLVCGVAGVAAGVCGGLAHKIWYKNWAIKSFLASSVTVVVLSLVALALTFYFTLSSARAYETHAQYESFMLERMSSQDGEQEQEEIIGTFFEMPTAPPSKSLVGNMMVGLLLQLVMSLWSVLIAWRGVRAQEFTPRRREELLKQIMAAAPDRKGHVDAEDVKSMPLAALYQLLQTHPELLQGAAPQQEPPQRPASRHSMDYRERVCRYLSKAHEADPIVTQGSSSPIPCHSSLKQPSIEAVPENKMAAAQNKMPTAQNEMAAAQNKDTSKPQSGEQLLASPTTCAISPSRKVTPSTSSSSSSPVQLRCSSGRTSSSHNEEPVLEKLPPSKECSEIEKSFESEELSCAEKSSDIKESSETEKSCETIEPSVVERSSEIKENSDNDKPTLIEEITTTENLNSDKITNHAQPQHLVLGLKTLPPLSTHLIKPSDLVPKRATHQMRRSSVGAKPNSPSDSEYNATLRNTLDRPPPVPRKEYGKPKFVLNADVHRMLARSEKQINGRPRQSRSISDLGGIERNRSTNELTCKDRLNTKLNNGKPHQVNPPLKDQPLKTRNSWHREGKNFTNSNRSRRASSPPRLHKKVKDRKPPPIPTTKDRLAQGPVNTNEDTCKQTVSIEADASNAVDLNDEKLSTAVNSGSASAGQKEHLEHDGPCAEISSQGKLSFTESHSLAMVHKSEVVASRSVPSSDSGVSSVLGSDDSISAGDASPPESHIGVVDESPVVQQASDFEKNVNEDKFITAEVSPHQNSAILTETPPLKKDDTNEESAPEVSPCHKSATVTEVPLLKKDDTNEESAPEVSSYHKSAIHTEAPPLKKDETNQNCEREKNATAEGISHPQKSIESEASTLKCRVCDNDVKCCVSPSKVTTKSGVEKSPTEVKDLNPKTENINPKTIDVSPKAEDLSPKAEDLSPKAMDLSPKAVALETSGNVGDPSKVNPALQPLEAPENNKNNEITQISSACVSEDEASKAREVPFVKSVILKNKDGAADGIRTNENQQQSPDLTTESLKSLDNLSRRDTGATKSSGTSSLPVTRSKDVKISFRSLRDETSIPTSFGSIKNNKSFEQILGAILSKAHNLTTSKTTPVSDSKKSSKPMRSKTSENTGNNRDSSKSHEQENEKTVVKKGYSSAKPAKTLTIEIRPYECRSIREEINSLKN